MVNKVQWHIIDYKNELYGPYITKRLAESDLIYYTNDEIKDCVVFPEIIRPEKGDYNA